MKKIFRLLGIIALCAIIAISFTACDPDKGGGNKITTKFRFTNSGSAQPTASIAVARSAVPLSVTINNSFASYTNFYSSTLGGNTNRKAQITPSSFQLEVNNLIICGTNTEHNAPAAIPLIENHGTPVEFIGNVPITPGEVFSGTYDMILSDSSAGNSGGQSIVKFKWPANAGAFADNLHMRSSGATIDGNGIVSVRMGNLMPGAVNGYLSGSGSPFQSAGISLYFVGNEHKLVTVGPSSTLTTKDLLSHYGNDILITTGPSFTAEAFIVPFTPITIPEDASTATFTISWNMDNMIEMYLPASKADNAANYCFVLKNGWWSALSISANIE